MVHFNADLSKYKDSMRPLIEKDIQKTMEKIAIVRNNEMEAVILPIEEYEG